MHSIFVEKLKSMKAHICDHQNTCFIKKAGKYKCLQIKIPILLYPLLSLLKDLGLKRKRKWLDHHRQPLVDRGWGMGGGDFGGKCGGTSTRSTVIASVGTSGWGCTIVVGGDGGVWMNGGNLCSTIKFMLKSTKSLKDLSEDSKVFLISKLVSMHSAKDLFSMVSSRLSCWRHTNSLFRHTSWNKGGQRSDLARCIGNADSC